MAREGQTRSGHSVIMFQGYAMAITYHVKRWSSRTTLLISPTREISHSSAATELILSMLTRVGLALAVLKTKFLSNQLSICRVKLPGYQVRSATCSCAVYVAWRLTRLSNRFELEPPRQQSHTSHFAPDRKNVLYCKPNYFSNPVLYHLLSSGIIWCRAPSYPKLVVSCRTIGSNELLGMVSYFLARRSSPAPAPCTTILQDDTTLECHVVCTQV